MTKLPINCPRALLLLFIILPLLKAGNSGAPARVALVIGNAGYQNSPLENTIADAQSIKAFLENAGFQVLYGIDLGKREMEEQVEKFKANLDPGSVALFYFSGHGVQLEGHNYLVPIDQSPRDAADVKYSCLDLEFIVAKMKAGEAGLNLIILDACRNNPFSTGNRSQTGGLVEIQFGGGTLIAYATGPGAVASDGGPLENGLYTYHLLHNLGTPGLPVEMAFKYTARDVVTASAGKQEPWYHSSILEDFSFFPLDALNEPLLLNPNPTFNRNQAVLAALRGMGGRIDNNKTRQMIANWAKEGDPIGVMWQARLLQKGWCSVPKNSEKAAKLIGSVWPQLTAASRDNQSEALFFEAFAYDEGLHVAKEPERAVARYHQAAEKGMVEAQYNLANMHEYGEGVTQSYDQAFRWYLAAARQGHAPAQTALGLFFEEGLGRDPNPEEARVWYLKAAKQGEPRACFNLALLLEKGLGGEVDREQAMLWYEKAAEQDDPLAQLLLGNLYMQGKAEKSDLAQAARWFAMAAKVGNADAQYNLALLHLGKMIDGASQSEARRLLQAATSQNHQLAGEALARLEKQQNQ